MVKREVRIVNCQNGTLEVNGPDLHFAREGLEA